VEFVDVGIPVQKELVLPRSREKIQQDLVVAQKELDEYANTGADFWDKLSEDSRQEIDRMAENVFENPEFSAEEKRQLVEKKFRECDGDEELTAVIKFCDAGYEAGAKVKRLQTEYLPYKKEEVDSMANDLSSRINFGKVLSYYQKEERQDNSDLLSNTLRETYFLRKIEAELAGGREIDFDKLDYYQNNLVRLQAVWQNKGFLNVEADKDFKRTVNDVEKNRENRSKLLEKINLLEADLKTFQDLASVYRLRLRFSSNPDKNLSDIAYALKQGEQEITQSMKDFDILDYDARFIEAAYDYVDDCEKELKLEGKLPLDESDTREYVENRRRDWNDTAKTMGFSGFVDKEGMELLLKQKDILAFLTSNFPASFLTGVTEIAASDAVFRKETNVIDGNGSLTSEEVTLGEFVPTYDNEGNFSSGKIVIYEPIHIKEKMGVLEKVVVKSKFEDTLAHEVGHGVQCNLSRDEMEAWEKTLDSDKTAVSWYVNYAREKGVEKGKREDFSESIMLFIKNPAVLQLISETRFNYMTQLFRRHMTDTEFLQFESNMKWSIELQKMVWERLGWGKQKIKDLYF
jgi:hypothetical protein